MKKVFLFLFVAVTAMLNAKAQTMNRDSVIRIAKAQNFKLNDADLERFRKTGRNGNSDYFKPISSGVSDVSLLKDSTYVKAYREMAFKKTKRRHTAGHFVLIGGIVAVVAIAVIYAATYTAVVTGYH
jgi:hypothetical protein